MTEPSADLLRALAPMLDSIPSDLMEFRPWALIPDDRKHEDEDGERWVVGRTFLGEPAWLPWMGSDG
jgi:hypothetical protein